MYHQGEYWPGEYLNGKDKDGKLVFGSVHHALPNIKVKIVFEICENNLPIFAVTHTAV
jgi:hypothetical protein